MFFMSYADYLNSAMTVGTSQLGVGVGHFLSVVPFMIYFRRYFSPLLLLLMADWSRFINRDVTWHKIGKPHICGFLSGMCSSLGNIAYMQLTASNEQASILAPMSSTYLLVPVLFGLTFRKERLTVQKAFGILIAVTAVVLLALSPQVNFDIGSAANIGWFTMVVLAWGLASILFMYAGEIKPFIVPLIYVDIGFTFLSLSGVALLYRDQTTVSIDSAELVIFFAGLLLGCGSNTYLACVNLYRDMSTISPLSALYTIIPTAMGILLLHESVTSYKIIGVVLSCIAGVLLSTENIHQLLYICKPSQYSPVALDELSKDSDHDSHV